MNSFINDDFLLQNKTAKKLYHDFAENLPIIDYHNHLLPDQIANDVKFGNLTQIWLHGDHYKWRAMRANGVDEKYCTGNATDYEKFEQWAATVPYTLRNPLYHWAHLELKRYFDIDEILSPVTARKIYDECTEKLQSKEYSVQNLLRKMKVEVLCTTDDPTDDLSNHQKIRDDGFEIKVLPTYRPDKAMNVNNAPQFNEYVSNLEAVIGLSITTYKDYLSALKSRHDFFASKGCRVSDHGLEQLYIEDHSESQINNIFEKIRSGNELSIEEKLQFQSALLISFAEWDWEKGWVQQYHLGALRNNNSRMLQKLGRDTGWDSIGDSSHARSISIFLDKMDQKNKLAKTILYNLNPSDNEVVAAMTGNFNDGSIAGKIQFGAAWWFLDQKDGITRQINSLSNMGLVSQFVGMVTDSRSFLSFPRHEYFRRIVCNLFGEEIESGELPADLEWTGKVIQDICYYNAKKYFNF